MTLEKRSAKRLYLLIAFMSLWVMGIGLRLCLLQVVQSEDFRQDAQVWQEETVALVPPRGAIFDSGMSELALSTKVEGSVFANPSKVENAQQTAAILSRITKVPAGKLLSRLKSGRVSVAIKQRISDSERSALKKANLPGVYFKEEFRRFYPNRQLAAHVLGYVGTNEVGRGGLELQYDNLLRGEPGEVTLMVDALGKTFERSEKAPRPGADLITTIDRRIQFIIEEELAEAARQTRASGIYIIAQNPHTGAILGMASYPTFNPNEYTNYSPASWKNPAVELTYEPGSTFKIVTAAAALEENLTTPDERIFCENGFIVIAGHRINDHKPFGTLSVSEIMQQSSDVGIIKLGLRVGDERFAGYIERLGFGRRTEIDLPGEAQGQNRPVSQWTKHSIGSKSMGQEIAVTPLQIVNLVSMIANGGVLYRPYVVQKIKDPVKGITEIKPQGQRVLTSKTAGQIRGMLEEVVTEGTGKGSRLDGYRAAGKTGTAQKYDPKIRTYSPTNFIASFAGFAPASKPEVSLVVVVDEPKGRYHGGDVAAPIFKRIAEQILRARSVAPDVPDYTPTYLARPEKTPSAPARRLQEPESGWKALDAAAFLPEGGAYEAGEIVVPDFVGQNLREIDRQSRELGLKTLSVGSGRAQAQYPPAGARVRAGTAVKVRLSAR